MPICKGVHELPCNLHENMEESMGLFSPALVLPRSVFRRRAMRLLQSVWIISYPPCKDFFSNILLWGGC